MMALWSAGLAMCGGRMDGHEHWVYCVGGSREELPGSGGGYADRNTDGQAGNDVPVEKSSYG